VWVVHLETGHTVGFLRFEAGVQETFAVQVLPNTRFPELLEWNDARLAHSYVLPDKALAEVRLPSEADLQRLPGFHVQHGLDCYRQGQLDAAIAAFRQGVALQPDYPDARYHLGVALGEAEQYPEAIEHLQHVIAAEPERAEAYNSLGYLFSRQRQSQRAVQSYERAIELQPNFAQAHFNLGVTLLQMGDYARGWVEYEWRWQTGEFTPFQAPHPQWDGTPIPDKTLLIHTEQGAGDAVQFARYLPWAAQRCGRLIVVCPATLRPLLATIPGIAQLREPGQIGVSDFDTYLPLLSLPRVHGTTLSTIPAAMPYLDVQAMRRRQPRDTASSLSLPPSAHLQVGLVWAGSPTQRHDRQRSCPLAAWLPVLRVPGVAWYSLQKGERHRELAELPADLTVHDLDPVLEDYGALAILLAQLDLVISVDTSVAHVAGALGRPVWTVLSYVPDWRWLLEGETTPWYPTMRLFRQERPGDWAGVMARVAAALQERP